MLNTIITIILGAGLAAGAICIYVAGIRRGMQLSDGKEPAPMKTPAQVFREKAQAEAERKQQAEMAAAMKSLMDYTGEIEPEKEEK